MPRRYLIWFILIAIVLGGGWYKSVENRRDFERQAAWLTALRRLEAEASVEWRKLMEWKKSLNGDPDPRQAIEARLNEGRPLATRRSDGREQMTWKHPRYGIELEFDFVEEKLVAQGARSGTALLTALRPQPARDAFTSRAESVRQAIARRGGWIWLMMLVMAVCRGRDLAAAEALLVVSIAWGTAFLVAPLYSLGMRGIFANDMLLFAGLALFVSLVHLAWCAARLSYRPNMQFSLRTLLACTAVIAALLAMGPFGYVALSVLLAGMVVFYGAFRLAIP